MATILDRDTTPDGHPVVMVDVVGMHKNPSVIRVAELQAGTEYRQSNGKNVIQNHGEIRYDTAAERREAVVHGKNVMAAKPWNNPEKPVSTTEKPVPEHTR